MKRKWNKKIAVLAAAALVLTAGMTVEKAMAYFTTYVTASGGHELHLGFTTTIPEEKVSDWTKEITVQNTGDNACYVRVKAFAGNQYELRYDAGGSNSGWSTLGDDGYYYWKNIVEPGDSTDLLVVQIDHTNAEDDFNVIVVQECVPVSYDGQGAPVGWDHVDWTKKADVVRTESVTGGRSEK